MAQSEVDRAVAQFESRQPQLRDATAHFLDLIRTTIDDAGINYLTITGRAKSVASYAGKVLRVRAADPRADLAEAITDEVGVRVITYVQSDILAVAELLRAQFTVLDDRDLGQETASRGDFGYASRHLLISLDEGTEYRPLRCASVQLRTVLQHAWAEFEHDVRYKGTIPPEQVPDLDRRFTLAAGLLELADREFTTIRDRLQVGLGAARDTQGASTDPRISPPELATFLAGRYSNAGWSRTEHYEWIAGLLLELGVGSLDELGTALRDVDNAAVTAAMGYKFPPGAVRRLDDDLLASFGRGYADLPGNHRRHDALLTRLAKLA